MTDRYTMVRHDELWVRGELAESRVNFGEAIAHGGEIVARNRLDRNLESQCEDEMRRAREVIAPMRDARMRCVVTATNEEIESTIAITINDVSVVSTIETLEKDYALLKSAKNPTGHRALGTGRLIWLNGSAAVLLHEAIGHATEHGHAPLDWPSWLRVRDESRAGVADLIASEMPKAARRESFRDVPLRRMSNLIAEQSDAPYELPKNAIEIHLVAGGAYEPLTEIVTINVAVSTAGSFTIRAPRRVIARSLVAATGSPVRYPGVICSREGQELYVGSHAPVIITSELA